MHRRYVKLDVVPGIEPVKVYISQNDVRSRTLSFRLFARVGEFEIPAGAVMTLEGRKPDGGRLTVAGSYENLLVTFTLPEAAALVPGTIPCNVVISSGDNRLYTETILIIIDKDVLEGE